MRVNGKIRAREVRVIGHDGAQLGVHSLADAINMARATGVDLVEIAPNATPPVCRLVDFGKFRYEQSKRDKEARKHQHANKVKEIQLSPSIDPHDFGVKLTHAIDFLCEEMKVKVTLRFRGREMAHKEVGFQQVNNFIKELAPYAHPDAPPKLVGKGLNVMISPLPRNKRAKNPRQDSDAGSRPSDNGSDPGQHAAPKSDEGGRKPVPVMTGNGLSSQTQGEGFSNNPFSQMEIKVPQ